MARTIQVTPEQLESTAGRIESLAADYKTQYDQLYSETNAMASTWSGKDNVAFVQQIDGFKIAVGAVSRDGCDASLADVADLSVILAL